MLLLPAASKLLLLLLPATADNCCCCCCCRQGHGEYRSAALNRGPTTHPTGLTDKQAQSTEYLLLQHAAIRPRLHEEFQTLLHPPPPFHVSPAATQCYALRCSTAQLHSSG
jgi:hypothetical protein